MPNFTVTAYVSMAFAIIILALGGYCKILRSENSALESKNTVLAQEVKEKADALELCSKNTQALKDKDDQITKDALAAVAAASKQSQSFYNAATSLLKGKVIVPKIDSTNVNQYGGADETKKSADCNAMHQLLNDEVDRRQASKK